VWCSGGSVLVLDSFENGVTMSLAVVNTVLAASGGGLAAVTLEWFFNEYWSLMQVRCQTRRHTC
jgi:ammonia channel protein AmtB